MSTACFARPEANPAERWWRLGCIARLSPIGGRRVRAAWRCRRGLAVPAWFAKFASCGASAAAASRFARSSGAQAIAALTPDPSLIDDCSPNIPRTPAPAARLLQSNFCQACDKTATRVSMHAFRGVTHFQKLAASSVQFEIAADFFKNSGRWGGDVLASSAALFASFEIPQPAAKSSLAGRKRRPRRESAKAGRRAVTAMPGQRRRMPVARGALFLNSLPRPM